MLRHLPPRPGSAAGCPTGHVPELTHRARALSRASRCLQVVALMTVGLFVPGALDAHARDLATTEAPPIAGVLADPGDTMERWCWSGAWVYPVGDPRVLGEPEVPGAAGYRVLRPVLRGRRGVTHQGADLGNRGGGGTVRAAASGLVVRAAHMASNGYGGHIVIAHRLDEGGLVYSVYAHLVKGSITVREGEIVPAGLAIGRVGRTGRASTEHLHFEIRRPRNQELRWENAAVEDPLAFIQKRLTSNPDSASWAMPVICFSGRTSMPGVRMSTKKYVMPWCFGTSTSVRVRRIPQSA